MGQCVLRDLGFEFEEKGQKKEMLDTYLKEKLRAKYPDAINIQKQKSDVSDQGSQGLSQPKKRTTQSLYKADIEMTDGRLSRPFKNKKMKENVVQTENKDENHEKVRAKSFMTLPTFSSEHPSANKTPRRVEDNASVQSFEGQEIRYKENNGEDSIKLATSHHPRSISPHTSGRIDLFMGSIPLRMKSENTLGISGFRPSANAVENNMFKGIEKINLKEPAKPIEIKGFKNKYFQPVGHRTPSPKDGQHDNFLDDDEDFPYDDYQ